MKGANYRVPTILSRNWKQKKLTTARTRENSESVLLSITGTSTFILRRGDIESVAQGELDATGIVVLHFPKHHPIAVKHDMVDATIEEVVTCQFDIETMLEEVPQRCR